MKKNQPQINSELSLDEEQSNFAKFETFFAKERQDFFNSLTKEQQLLVFCEVVSKLTQAELVDKRSYRGVLYGEFGFDIDAYAKAQISGFLELHNSIETDPVNNLEFSRKVLKTYGIEQTEEQIEKNVATYVKSLESQK